MCVSFRTPLDILSLAYSENMYLNDVLIIVEDISRQLLATSLEIYGNKNGDKCAVVPSKSIDERTEIKVRVNTNSVGKDMLA
jgi:hypothetical protein